MTVRIGVIGCGDVSVVHFEAIRDIEGLELVGVADTDPQALARAVEATGVPGFASTQELIDGVGPDAAPVTTSDRGLMPRPRAARRRRSSARDGHGRA